jgi:uncharacterized membrane protein YphA (DoxX/SURF4 family)
MSVVAQEGNETVALQPTHWSMMTRVAFRFSLVYFSLFCLSGQIIQSVFPIPKVDQPEFDSLRPISDLIIWTGAHVFRLKDPVIYASTGSGDRTWDWIVIFLCLVTAALATSMWSVLDRKRGDYRQMHRWFLIFIRFCLASQLLVYGSVKAVPLQMRFPSLSVRVESFGNMSPMGILWSSIGASQTYEIFAGCAELTAGLLLIFPCTAMVGALVALADMTDVFLLNMTYDVPVKVLSFHLILLSLLLLAPERKRLAGFFFLDRAVETRNRVPLFGSRRANRIAVTIEVLLWIWIIGNTAYGSWDGWRQYGPGAPKSPLYGIWNVVQFSSDGQVRPPLLTDGYNWQRLIFDYPGLAVFQRMDGSMTYLPASVDAKAHTIKLSKRDDNSWHANLTFNRPSSDQLIVAGNMAGHRVEFQLTRVDETKFLFANRGFHWVQERPFNR